MANNAENYRQDFNNNDYYYKVTLWNGIDGFTPVELPHHNIEQLVIEDTFFNWNVTGHLIIRSEYDVFERSLVNADGLSDADTLLKPLYTFRNDGRNKINVRIYPMFDKDQPITESREPETWELNFDFVVYNVEDIPSTDVGKKCKKLYFWDERYQHFLERNIQWSTYYVAAEKLKTKKPLREPVCKVAEAIKHLIQTACGENDLNAINSNSLLVGSLEGESAALKTPTLKVASFNDGEDGEWDDKCEKNIIFYTSPASYSVIEDLNYLLQYYVANTETEGEDGLGNPGILRLHRYTKKWELTGINKIFKTAGKDTPGADLIEHFYLQGPYDLNPIDGVPKTPISDGTSLTKDVHTPASLVLSYRFVGMAAQDDLNITNRPVIKFENLQNHWDIFRATNTAEKIKTYYLKDYLPYLYTADEKGALVSLNKDKLNGLNTTPMHVITQGKSLKVLARNQMIANNIILNQGCEFTVQGLTCRAPGKFISIDRTDNLSKKDNDYEDRIIGQWLITKVTHTFIHKSFISSIVGAKMHSFQELTTFMPDKDQYKE